MYYDWTYIFVIIMALIAMLVSANLKSTYRKYSKVYSKSGITAAQAAQALLQAHGIYDISINQIPGELTDHFNPSTGEVNLSQAVYSSTSIAALGVAAHECGHVMQHKEGYAPIKIRNAFVPIANFGTKAAFPLIILGVILSVGHYSPLITIGILLYSFAVLFQLLTLPVEFNASRRALETLVEQGILYPDERAGAASVLRSAAMTYVAAAASAIVQLLRLVYIFGGRDRD